MLMKRIPESLIEDIRSKTDIVDFISQYLPLNRKGKNYWGICPFHDDSDPSMSVSPDKQIYKCFVCGHGGNVFRFVQDFDKLSFVDSVIKVGESINLDLSDFQRETVEIDPQLKDYYKIMEEAQTFLNYQLYTDKGAEGLKILHDRGYSDEILKKFNVGLALSSESLSTFLSAKNYDEQDLIDVNLSRDTDRGLQDVFFDRLMFPIQDQNGKVIAYSGRAIQKDHDIKYINTSNTRLYTKGNVIYNYHRAKDPARHADSIIITEGVTDVFAFSIAGFDNVVSLLGVAGTDQQIKEVARLNRNVILAFDGDEAGQTASYKIGMKFKEMRCKVAIWYNDSAMDPDDLLKKQGPKAIKDGLDNKIDWLDYIVYYAMGAYGLNSFENKKRVAKFVIEHLSNEDQLAKEYYMNQIAEKTELDRELLNGFITNGQEHRQETSVRMLPKRKESFKITIPEQSILKQMLYSKEAAHRYRDQLGFLIDDRAQSIGLILLDAYRTKDYIEIADLLSMDFDETMKDLILELDSNSLRAEYDERAFDEEILQVKRRLANLGMKQLKTDSRNQNDIDSKYDLLMQAIDNRREGESE